MDQDLKKKLIMIGVIFALAAVFYYFASPFQQCMRATGDIGNCTIRAKW